MKCIEIFEKYDSNFQNLKQDLEKYKKYSVLDCIKSNLFQKIKENFLGDPLDKDKDDSTQFKSEIHPHELTKKLTKNEFSSSFNCNNCNKSSYDCDCCFRCEPCNFNLCKNCFFYLNEISKLVQSKELKFKFEYMTKPDPYSYDGNEYQIQESVKKLEYVLKNKKDIIWKPCREILGRDDIVILPEKIDNSNFNQGFIGDCYFISCVNALSQIPQLLNFILGLSSKYIINEIDYNFRVKFFIDGKWQTIKVKDSFPCFKDNNQLVGVTPKKNELFMMILEKAWAQINGGYDQIEGGSHKNIFELFLGCTCKSFNNENIKKAYQSIKKNEEYFGTLSLCSSNFLNILNKNIYKNYDNFDKKDAIDKKFVNKGGLHAYRIVKTLEIESRSNKENYDPCKFLIIANPHGKSSDLISNGIELKKINNILEKKFGVGNKNQYEYILDKNKKYGYKYFDNNNNKVTQKEGTGIIFMPLDYYKEWSSGTSVCNPHYGCLSYTLDIKDQLENLYIFKIKLKEKQLFTCQVCFQSFRAHRDKIDKIYKIFISRETNNETKNVSLNNSFLLNYNYCGIKIIKNDNDFNVMKNYCSYRNDYDFSSIKEASSSLDPGEFLIMVYPESSINEGVIRFLSEKEIEIDLLSKNNIKNKYNITNNTEEIFNNIFKDNDSRYKRFNYKDF